MLYHSIFTIAVHLLYHSLYSRTAKEKPMVRATVIIPIVEVDLLDAKTVPPLPAI